MVQSGGIGVSLTEHLSRLGIGISSFVSVGDKCDVPSNDLLPGGSRTADPPGDLVPGIVRQPAQVRPTARRVGARCPCSPSSAVAPRRPAGGASHTAAAATPLVTREALFEQAGVIVTESLGDLIGTAAFLSSQPCPAGRRVAVVSNAGGAGVLAADACVDGGLVPRHFGADQAAAGRDPPIRCDDRGPSRYHRRDRRGGVRGNAWRHRLRRWGRRRRLRDRSDGDGRPHPGNRRGPAAQTARRRGARPGREREAGARPAAAGVPAFAYPEGAVRALSRATRYGTWRDQRPGEVPDLPGVRAAKPEELVADFLGADPDGGWLPAAEARLLRCYQLPMAPFRLVTDADQAAAAAAELGGPVVLKAQAWGLVHKTEAGAVRLDLAVPTSVGRLPRAGRRVRRQVHRRSGRQPMLSGGAEVHHRRRGGTSVRAARGIRARRGRHGPARRSLRPAQPR